MPVKKHLAIARTVYPLDYNKNNPGTDEHFNSIANHHRNELRKLCQACQIAGTTEAEDRQMSNLLDQAQELITTNYKRP